MKTITLTGLRNEVDMRTGQTTGFGLVFNDGDLHIEVTQEVMQEVVEYAFRDGEEEPPVEQYQARKPMTQDETVDVPETDEDIPQL